MSTKDKTGFAIAIAWPETFCKQPGSWYDSLMTLVKINKNNYYKVGHAALVLVDSQKEKAFYFDFGRYHTPFQHGRVRGANTDDELKIKTKPIFSKDKLVLKNYEEILKEVQNNEACHGEGKMHASYTLVNFEKAKAKVTALQNESPLPYGPFIYNGSNCSRFVSSVILAGKPTILKKLKLKYKVPFTPTPISNVKALTNKTVLSKMLENEVFYPNKKMDKRLLKSTLPAPENHFKKSKNAQWLSGEGAGSWFDFEIKEDLINVTRYSPKGKLESEASYKNEEAIHKIKKSKQLKITYPSNSKAVYFKAENQIFAFNRVV